MSYILSVSNQHTNYEYMLESLFFRISDNCGTEEYS